MFDKTILTKQAVENIIENWGMMVTSIFSHFHNVIYLSNDKFHFLGQAHCIACKFCQHFQHFPVVLHYFKLTHFLLLCQSLGILGAELTIKASFTTIVAFGVSVDQDQAAQNVQPDL